jgi:hypothetical protein
MKLLLQLGSTTNSPQPLENPVIVREQGISEYHNHESILPKDLKNQVVITPICTLRRIDISRKDRIRRKLKDFASLMSPAIAMPYSRGRKVRK